MPRTPSNKPTSHWKRMALLDAECFMARWMLKPLDENVRRQRKQHSARKSYDESQKLAARIAIDSSAAKYCLQRVETGCDKSNPDTLIDYT